MCTIYMSCWSSLTILIIVKGKYILTRNKLVIFVAGGFAWMKTPMLTPVWISFSLNDFQKAYFQCAYECFDRRQNQEAIGSCVENCSVPVLSANHVLQDEMAKFQVLRAFLHLSLFFHRCYAILVSLKMNLVMYSFSSIIPLCRY
jgi:hypothetical protein